MSLTTSDIARVWTSAQHQFQIQKSMRQFSNLRKNIKRRHRYMNENMTKKYGKQKKDKSSVTIQNLLDALRDFTYHTQSADEVARKLGTNLRYGLTDQEVKRRKNQGQNFIEGLDSPNYLLIYLKQVSDPFSLLLWGLIVLCIIAYILIEDFNQLLLAIILFITINSCAAIAFFYEKKSLNDMSTLKKMIPNFATVIRNGNDGTCNTRDLVKGDIIVLKSGEKIPADVRVTESNGLKMNRSTFTGQSDPIQVKMEVSSEINPLDSKNMAFSGAIIEEGEGKGIVVNIGKDMIISNIKEVLANVQKNSSYLEDQLSSFVIRITIFAVCIGVFTFFGGWGVGFPVIIAADIAIGVMVASAPGILNLELTCILCFSLIHLAKKNMICKRFSAAQSLGSTQILCTDKTGTLTTNRMTMQNIYYNGKTHRATSHERYAQHEYDINDKTFNTIMKCAVLSSISKFDVSVPKQQITKLSSRIDLLDSQKKIKQQIIDNQWKQKLHTMKYEDRQVIGDSTESALIRFFQPIHDIEVLREQFPIIKSLRQNRDVRSSFNSLQKYSYSIHREQIQDSYFCLYLKGAPEKVWNLSRYIMKDNEEIKKTPQLQKQFHDILNMWGKEGKRVLAFAKLTFPGKRFHKNYDFSLGHRNFSLSGLTFLGMVSLHDPPRHGVPKTIKKLRQAGVKVVMVTGDQEITAIEIARQCNLISREKTSAQYMRDENLSFQEAFVQCKNLVINGDQLRELMQRDELLPKSSKGKDFIRILQKDGIIFARTTPAQKLYITQQFQKLGYNVTVTGDGVNDSPAIKIANTGIAMNSGADAAKQSADIVIANDDFNKIYVGIEEGRRLFDNLKKAICYVMTSQVSQWMPFVFLITTRIPIPIFTLLIDGAVDFVPTLAFAFQSAEQGIMTRHPRHKTESLINFKLMAQAQGWMGFSSFVCCLLAYYIVMIDYGFVPSTLWGNSNKPILLERLDDHYNPSDPFYGNTNLRNINSCEQFDERTVPVDWINTLYPHTDLRTSAVTCHIGENGKPYFRPFLYFSTCRIQNISPYSGRPVCYTPQATKYGQTSYMLANVVNQLFNWFICRTRIDSSIFKKFNNKIFVFGIGFEFMLAMALCYLPFMQKLISTRDVVFEHWGLSAIPFALIQLSMDEVRKYLMRTLPADSKTGKPNWFVRNTLW